MDSITRPLPQDNFQIRESILTELFETNVHVRTIRNLFVAFFLYLLANTVVADYFQNGGTEFGFRLIKYCFGQIHIAALSWISFVAITFCGYFIFKVWANVRINLSSKFTVKPLDTFGIFLVIDYCIFTFSVPMYIVRTFDLPLASAAIVLAEQLRIAMKCYAFLKSSAPNVFKCKLKDGDFLKVPTFRNFAYFMFAPTMIYKDEYPRTKTIRWNFAACRLLEVLAELWYFSMIFDQYILPPYRDFGIRKFTWLETLIAILRNSAPAMVAAMLCFYVVLHSVHNFFAEILRFGDRTFYGDWWTCTDYSEFYSKWNLVIHNWLYTFVYREIRILAPRCRSLATMSVFLLSAVVHEWAYCNMIGGFFPAITIQFAGIGVFLYFVKVPKKSPLNVIFLCSFALGTSICLCFYSLEHYARQNAPLEDEDTSIWNRALPRFLTCDCFQY